MAEYVIEPRSLEDQYILTRMIETGIDETAFIGNRIAPLISHPHRKVKVKIREADPASIGQFKATNASTPIRKGGFEVVTQYIELVQLEEKEALTEDDLVALFSNDNRVAKLAARNIVDVGMELRRRNANLTEFMRWKAFADELLITYQDGTTISIDYDLNNTDGAMGATHKPNVATAWSDAAADIIGDIQGWSDQIEDDIGIPGVILWVNRATFRDMQKNTAIKNEISTWGRRTTLVTAEDIIELLDIDELVVFNGFYRDAAKVKNLFIPDDRAMLTSPLMVDGAPIAEVYDGPVVTVAPDGRTLRVGNNPGAASEMYDSLESKTRNIRVSTARMPWLRREAFIWADVS